MPSARTMMVRMPARLYTTQGFPIGIGSNKLWVAKVLSQNKFWVQKMFWFGHKNVGSTKMFGQKYFGSVINFWVSENF